MKKGFALLLSVVLLLTLVTGCVSQSSAPASSAPASSAPASSAPAPAAFAQDGKIPIPDSLKGKTLTLTCGWSSGSLEIMCRTLQAIIKERQGVDIVVEIMEGSGGSVAMLDCLNGPKDGTRLTIGGPNTFIFMNDGSLPSEVSDYTFVSSLIRESRVCLVRPDSPITTIEQFADLLTNGPNKPYQIASTSAGGVGEAAALSVIAALGLDNNSVVSVPFPGPGRSIAELLGGHVDFVMCKFSDCPSQLASGEVRPLFSQTYDKVEVYPGMELFPDVPTIVDTDFWGERIAFGDPKYLTQCLVGPPGMPQDVVDFYAALFKDALESDTYQEKCREAALTTDPVISGEEMKGLANQLRNDFGIMVETYYK